MKKDKVIKDLFVMIVTFNNKIFKPPTVELISPPSLDSPSKKFDKGKARPASLKSHLV